MNLPGFSAQDFDAYLPNKWRSNVFSRERLEVKSKLVALGEHIAPSLRTADGSPLEVDLSAEHPALWNQHQVRNQQLFFSRPRAAREEVDGIVDRKRGMASLLSDPSPHRGHIVLAVTVDAEGLGAALWLHRDAAVDRENLERRCADFFQREQLLGEIRSLPEEMRIGLAGGDAKAARALDDDGLQALVAALGATADWLCCGRRWGREAAIAAGPAVGDQVRDALVALLPVYRTIAWSRDNDLVSMKEAIAERKQSGRSRGLAAGDRVRVVRGVFSGRAGVVQEVDGKGALKVLLGPLPVRIAGEDVVKL